MREYLIENNKLPAEVDILFINDCMNAGFSLRDESIDLVIAESNDLAVLLQVMGRVRTPYFKFVAIYNLKGKRSFEERYRQMIEFRESACEQGFLKAWYFQERKQKNDELFVFKCGNSFGINPFAFGVYEYLKSCFVRLNNSAEYFSSLSTHCKKLKFISGKALSAKARNRPIQTNLNIPSLFGLEDGQTEKFITAKELKAIANGSGLRFDNGKPYGKEKLAELINASTEWSIKTLGQKRINGIKASWYALSKNGG